MYKYSQSNLTNNLGKSSRAKWITCLWLKLNLSWLHVSQHNKTNRRQRLLTLEDYSAKQLKTRLTTLLKLRRLNQPTLPQSTICRPSIRTASWLTRQGRTRATGSRSCAESGRTGNSLSWCLRRRSSTWTLRAATQSWRRESTRCCFHMMEIQVTR